MQENGGQLQLRGEIVLATTNTKLLNQIRPHWRSKNLIERVRKLLPVDPSSACQRLFNAAIQDLREKIIVAGIDIAAKTAADHKLPTINKPEDVLDSYSVQNLIDLSYRIGFLDRPEWRRLRRCYDIRKDLEHEDSEYEATIEDIVYIFTTCVTVVLSRDPIQLLRVEDIKHVVESASTQRVPQSYADDFKQAPDTRQLEILKYLTSKALSDAEVQVVQSNAVEALRALRPHVRDPVKLDLARLLLEKLGRESIGERFAKVVHACGIFSLVPASKRSHFFAQVADSFDNVGYSWKSFKAHEALLSLLDDLGGLASIPDGVLNRFVRWLLLCYLGEPGGYGYYGANRKVFFSDTASPEIERIFKTSGPRVAEILPLLRKEKLTATLCKHPPIQKRFDDLLDITTTSGTET
jgi:hypothetical protein